MTDGLSNRVRYSPGRFFLIALLFVAAAPVYWQRVELGETALTDATESADLYHYVYPVFDYAFGRLGRGDVPLWNPRQWCGVPLAADPRVGLFEPLHAIFLTTSTARALAVHAFVCLGLMGFLFALFARSLGLRYGAALIGGIVYAYAGASSAAMSRPAAASALVWLPFVFWAATGLVRAPGTANLILTGLGLALVLLAGSPGLAVVAAALLAPYVAVQVSAMPARRFSDRVPSLVALAGAVLLGAAASAVQWWLTATWILGGRVVDAGLWNVHMAAQAPSGLKDLLAQLVVPTPGTLPRLAYLGTVTLLLIPAAFLHARLRRLAVLFAVALVAGLGLTLWPADASPAAFPPTAFAFAALFSAAALAAIGADRLLEPRREPHPPKRRYVAAAVAAASIVLLAAAPALGKGYVIVFGLVTAAFLAIHRRWASVIAGGGIAFLLIVDLMLAGRNVFSHPYQDAPQCYRRYASAVAAAADQAGAARVMTSAPASSVALTPNLGMAVGIRSAGGRDLALDSAQRAWWSRLPSAAAPEQPTSQPPLHLLNYASVRALLVSPGGPLPPTPPPVPGIVLREVPVEGGPRLYGNETALPRAYWVPAYEVAKTADAAAARLADTAFRGDWVCLLDAPLDATFPPAPTDYSPGTTPGRWDAACFVEDVSPEEVKVVVDAPQRGITVLTDSFSEGWEVRMDGVPSRLLRANGIFRGVETPPGRHEFRFRYRPPAFHMGTAVSVATLGLAALLGVVGLFRRA